MTNYREILRLDSLGLNKSQIAEATGYSRTTVITVLRQAETNGISYPIPQTISDKELAGKHYLLLRDRLSKTYRQFCHQDRIKPMKRTQKKSIYHRSMVSHVVLNITKGEKTDAYREYR